MKSKKFKKESEILEDTKVDIIELSPKPKSSSALKALIKPTLRSYRSESEESSSQSPKNTNLNFSQKAKFIALESDESDSGSN